MQDIHFCHCMNLYHVMFVHILTVAFSLYAFDVLNVIYESSENVADILIFSLFRVDRYAYIKVQVKVEFTLEQAAKPQRGSRGIGPFFL
jgi:hypothetical protein